MFALLTFCAVAGAALLPNSRAAIAIVDTASISDSSTTVGVSDNDMFFVSTDPAQIAERLDKMQSLGVQNIRLAIPWSTVETAPGQYNWTAIDNMVNAAAARGIGVLGVINTTPAWARGTYTNLYAPPDNPATLGTFASALASRYAGKVSAYEVWNEPNSAFAYQPSPDPAGYTALLKAAYTAIKAADPKAQVIGAVVGATQTWGSLTLNPVDFVQQMYAAGAKGYFDALSFHPYQWSLPFSAGNIVPGSPLQQANAIYQLMQANGDGLKKIWSSEYGVPTGIPGVGNQASMINDFLTTWSNLSYAGPTFLYTLVDRNSSNTWDAESTFGLFTDSWIAKAAAQVVKDFIAAHPQNPGTSTPPPPVVTNPFEAWAAAVQASVQAWLQQIAAAIAAAFSPAPAATTTTAKTLAVAQTTTSSTAPSSTTSATPAPATTGEPAALAASGTTAATTTSSTPVATSAAPTSTSASSAAPSTTTQTSAARSSQSTATTTSSAPTTTAVTTTSPSTATSVATTATSTAATTSAAAATGTTSAAPTTSSGPSTTAATTTQQTPATTAAK
ncbi:endo-1,4-beta-xylanase [Williamsia deligens]|uniref:Endo-1,4-beta-xylanase n=1 Tax=Williamsia deligens TaxID=321325 RepID=A0ABW3G4F0_9NOCA|nr:endo-1,4-beta-xylanase [Williamsia deligens]